MEIKSVNKNDVITYQVIVAVIVGAAVFAGAHFGGHYLHESEAHTIQIGDRAKDSEGDHQAALMLASGYRDTKAYDAMKGNLHGAEESSATVVPHVVEKFAPVAAIVGAVIGFVASAEAARIHARKKLAQASIGKATQRFQKP